MFLSKEKFENILSVLESQANQIQELTKEIDNLKKDNENIKKDIYSLYQKPLNEKTDFGFNDIVSFLNNKVK